MTFWDTFEEDFTVTLIWLINTIREFIWNVFDTKYGIIPVVMVCLAIMTLLSAGITFLINVIGYGEDRLVSDVDRNASEMRSEERHQRRLAESEARYRQRQLEAQQRYEERRRERFNERYPLLQYHSIDELAAAYFTEYPQRVSFSYGGQTVYNEELLRNLETAQNNRYAEFWRNEINSTMAQGLTREEAIELIRQNIDSLGGTNTGVPEIDNSRRFFQNFSDVLN